MVDTLFVVPTICFTAIGMQKSLLSSGKPVSAQRPALWLGCLCLFAAIGFLAFLSIRFDFGDCPNPSQEHPYLIAGRLVLVAVVPFLVFFFMGYIGCFAA